MSRACPSCGERLSEDAERCVCGWTVRIKRGRDQPQFDHVCQWAFGALRCKYPVGLFTGGALRGLCIFHRAQPNGHAAARIAEESQGATQEQYIEAAKLHVYGRPNPDGSPRDNANVAALRARLHKGSGDLAKLEMPCRDPGADEMEETGT